MSYLFWIKKLALMISINTRKFRPIFLELAAQFVSVIKLIHLLKLLLIGNRKLRWCRLIH